jgi:hypothetical protein
VSESLGFVGLGVSFSEGKAESEGSLDGVGKGVGVG